MTRQSVTLFQASCIHTSLSVSGPTACTGPMRAQKKRFPEGIPPENRWTFRTQLSGARDYGPTGSGRCCVPATRPCFASPFFLRRRRAAGCISNLLPLANRLPRPPAGQPISPRSPVKILTIRESATRVLLFLRAPKAAFGQALGCNGRKRGREYFAGTALRVLRTKYSRPNPVRPVNCTTP